MSCWNETDLAVLQKYIDSGEKFAVTEIKRRYGISKSEDAIRKKLQSGKKTRFEKQVSDVKDKKRKTKKEKIEETVEDIAALQNHLKRK